MTPAPPPTATLIPQPTKLAERPSPTPAPVIRTATPTARPTLTLQTPTPTSVPIEVHYECMAGLRLERGEACSYADGDQSDFVLAVRDDGSTYLDGDVGPLSLSEKIFRPDAKVCACGLETEWDGNARTITALPNPISMIETNEFTLPTSPDLGECVIGMEVRAGQVCRYPGTYCAFEVKLNGGAQFLSFLEDERIEATNVLRGDFVVDLVATADDDVWRILMVPEQSGEDSITFCPLLSQEEALWSAAYYGDIDYLRLNIREGANVDARNPVGTPMLGVAALAPPERWNESVVTALIEAGADVNARGAFGTPILVEVARTGNTDALALLLRAGADANLVDQQGATALQNATWSREAAAIRILLMAGADAGLSLGDSQPPVFTALIQSTELLNVFLQNGADPDTRNSHGMPLLSRAMSIGLADRVDIILATGANPNLCDAVGNPPLRHAIQSGRAEHVRSLVSRGAEVNVIDSWGDSMLMKAVLQQNVDIIRILVEAGANVNAGGAHGDSILTIAGRLDSREIVQILIDAGAE